MDVPAGFELSARIEDELASRLLRQRQVKAIDYKPSSVLPEKQLAPTGSLAIFVGRRGNTVLDAVRKAATDPKGGADRRLIRSIQRTIQSRRPLAFEEAVRLAIASPILAELRYGGATYRKHLPTPAGDDVIVSVLPYAGGPLAKEGFTFVEYFHEEDADQGLDIVIVKNDPILSRAEQAALKKVPPDLVHVFVHPGSIHENTVVVATVLYAVEVAIVWATFTVVKSHDDKSMEHINPAAIEDLGPLGTARMLLDMRRNLLRGKATI